MTDDARICESEQVRGEPITTASTSTLGVLLYELVTGHRPYRITGRSQLDLVRVICEEEPEKPSTIVVRNDTVIAKDGETRIEITAESVSRNRDSQPDKLRRRLKGDIDNIVLMAMRKEPQRRYSSADQLASDIKRHLDGLPVIARRDTLGYRSIKFIKRNRVGVAAAVLIIATLIAGVASTMIQRAKAEHRFNDVRKLANSFMFEVHDAIEDLPGSTVARELLVKRALEYLDSLSVEASGDTSLQRELATSYQKVGEVQGRPSDANLGNPEGAMESFRKALGIREALVEADPRNVQDRLLLATSHSRIAEILEDNGDQQGAMDEYQKARAIREEVYAADPNDPARQREVAISYFEIGEALTALGDFNGALDIRRKMLPIFQSLADSDPSSANARRSVSLSYKKLGATLARLERLDEALASYATALEMDEAALSSDPTNARKRIDLSYSVSDYGYVLASAGKTAQALECYRRALQIREELAAADPKDERARSSLATTHAKFGWVYSLLSNTTASLDHFRKAIAIREAMVAANAGNVASRAELGGLYAGVGDAFALVADAPGNPVSKRTEYLREARSWYQRSLDYLADLAREKGEQAVSATFAEGTRAKIARCDEALKKK
jgi:non-specific serine/threonine protein kinase/serine/threonine-protein kinase